MSMYKTIFVTESENQAAAGEKIFSVNGEVKLTGDSAFASLNEAVAAVAAVTDKAIVIKVASGKYENFTVINEGMTMTDVNVVAVDFNGGEVMIGGENITVADSGLTAEAQASILADLNDSNAGRGKVFVAADVAPETATTLYVGIGDAGYVVGADAAVIAQNTAEEALTILGNMNQAVITATNTSVNVSDYAGFDAAYDAVSDSGTIVIDKSVGSGSYYESNKKQIKKAVTVKDGAVFSASGGTYPTEVYKTVTVEAGGQMTGYFKFNSSWSAGTGKLVLNGTADNAAVYGNRAVKHNPTNHLEFRNSATFTANYAEITALTFISKSTSTITNSDVFARGCAVWDGKVEITDSNVIIGSVAKQFSATTDPNNVFANTTIAGKSEVVIGQQYNSKGQLVTTKPANADNIKKMTVKDTAKVYFKDSTADNVSTLNVQDSAYISFAAGVTVTSAINVSGEATAKFSDITVNSGKSINITGSAEVTARVITNNGTINIASSSTLTLSGLAGSGAIKVNIVDGFENMSEVIKLTGTDIDAKTLADKITFNKTGYDAVVDTAGKILIVEAADAGKTIVNMEQAANEGKIGSEETDLKLSNKKDATVGAAIDGEDVEIYNDATLTVTGSVNASGNMDITNAAGATISGAEGTAGAKLTAAGDITMTNNGHADVDMDATNINIKNNSVNTLTGEITAAETVKISADKVTVDGKEQSGLGKVEDATITAKKVVVSDQIVDNTTVNGTTRFLGDSVVEDVTVNGKIYAGTMADDDETDFSGVQNSTLAVNGDLKANTLWIGAQYADGKTDGKTASVTVAEGASITTGGANSGLVIRESGELTTKGDVTIGHDQQVVIQGKVTVDGENASFVTQSSGVGIYKENAEFVVTNGASATFGEYNDTDIYIGKDSDNGGGKLTVEAGSSITINEKLNIKKSGQLTVSGSTFTAEEVANAGTFTVSGNSSLNIDKLTGIVKADSDTTLTDSNIGGGDIYVGYTGYSATPVALTIDGTKSVLGGTIWVGTDTAGDVKHSLKLEADDLKVGSLYTRANSEIDITSKKFEVSYINHKGAMTIDGTDMTIREWLIGNKYTSDMASVTVKDSVITQKDNGGFTVGYQAAANFSMTDSTLNMTYSGLTINAGSSFEMVDSTLSTSSLTNNGTITVDADSKITAQSLTGNGTITIDASDWTGYNKVLDLSGTASMEGKVQFTGLEDSVRVIYGADGDVTLIDTDPSAYYVNTAYAGLEVGTAIEGKTGVYAGINAFGDYNSALNAAPDGMVINVIGSNPNTFYIGKSDSDTDVTVNFTGDVKALWKNMVRVDAGSTGNVINGSTLEYASFGVRGTLNAGSADGETGTVTGKNFNIYGENGYPAAELNVYSGSTLSVNDGSQNTSYIGHGSDATRKGKLNILGGTASAKYLKVHAGTGEINVENGTLNVTSSLTNDGYINVTDAFLTAGTIVNNGNITLTVTDAFLAGLTNDVVLINQTNANAAALDISVNIAGKYYALGDYVTTIGNVDYYITKGDGNDIVIDAQFDTIFVNDSYDENTVGFGFNKFSSFTDAMVAASENSSVKEIKISSDITEAMPTDIFFKVTNDVKITADSAVSVHLTNDGTKNDIVMGSLNGSHIAVGENVSIKLDGRPIWFGHQGYVGESYIDIYGVVDGGQWWNGQDATVHAGGKLISSSEAMVFRNGATLTVNGDAAQGAAAEDRTVQLDANYMTVLSGNLMANNTAIKTGPIWVDNTGGYSDESGVWFKLDNTVMTSSGNLKLHSDQTALFEVTNGSTLTINDTNGYGASEIGKNGSLWVYDSNATINKGVNNAGDIDIANSNFVVNGTLTNSGFVNVADSTLDVDKFTNITSGDVIDTFNVSGNSTVKINDLSGQVYLADGTVLGEGSYINSSVIPKNSSSIKAIGSLTLNDGFTGGHLYALGKNPSKGPGGVGGVITINGTATFDNGFTVSNDYVINGGKIVLNTNNPNGNYGFVLGTGTIVVNADVEVDGNGKAVSVQMQKGDITLNSNFVHKNHKEAIFIQGSDVKLSSTGSIDATTIIVNDNYGLDSSLNVNGGSVVANQLEIKENAEVNVDGGNVAIKQVVVNSGALNANGDVTFKADKLTSTSETPVAFGSTSEERSNIKLGSVSGKGLNMTASRVNIYNADVTLTDNVSVTTTGVLSKILDANVNLNGKTLTYTGFTVLDSASGLGSNTGVTLSNGNFNVNTNHLCFQGYDHVISSDAVVNVDTSMHNSGMVNVYGSLTIEGQVNVTHGNFGYDNVGTTDGHPENGWPKSSYPESILTVKGANASYTIENGHMFRVYHATEATGAGTLNVLDGASFSFTGSREGTGLFFNSNRVYVDAASSFTVDSYYGNAEGNSNLKGAFNSENAGEMVVLGNVTVNKQLVTDSLIVNQGGVLSAGSITVTDLTIAIGGSLNLNGSATVSSGYINVIGELKPENAEYTLVTKGWDKLSGLQIRYDINNDKVYSTDEMFTVGTVGTDGYLFTVNGDSLYISKQDANITGIYIGDLGNAAYGETFIADDGAKYTVGKDAFASMDAAKAAISDKSLVTSLTLGSADLVSAAKAEFVNLNDIRVEAGVKIKDSDAANFTGNVNIDNDGHLDAQINVTDGGLTFTNTSDLTLLGSYTATNAIVGTNSGTMGGTYTTNDGISIDNTFGNINDATTFTAGGVVDITGGDTGNVTVNANGLHLTDTNSFGLNASSGVLTATGTVSNNMWGVNGGASAIQLNGSANLSINGDASITAGIDSLLDDHTGTVTFNGKQTYTGDIASNKFVVAENSTVTVNSNQFDFNELNIAGKLSTNFTKHDAFTQRGSVTGAGSFTTTHTGAWIINDSVETDFSGFTGSVSMADADASIVMGKGDAVPGSDVSSYFADGTTVNVNGAQSVVLAKDGVNTAINFAGTGTINVGNYIVGDPNGKFAEQSTGFTQTLSGKNSGFSGTVNVSEGAALTLKSAIGATTIDLDAPSTSTAAEDATKLILDAADVVQNAAIYGDANDIIDVNANQTLNKIGALDNFSGTVDLNVNEITLNGANDTAAKFTGTADSIIDANADLTLSAAAALNDFKGTVELEGDKLILEGENITDAKFTGTGTIDADANQTLNATGAINGFAGTVDLGANELTLEGANETAATFKGTGIIDANADQILNGAGALDAFSGIVELDQFDLTLNDVNNTAAKFTGTADSIINANANQILNGTGALNQFNGDVNIADNTSVTLNGVNTTSAEFVGGATAALNVNADQFLNADNTNFDGKLNINSKAEVQFNGDFGTVGGNSTINFNANDSSIYVAPGYAVDINSKLVSNTVTGEIFYIGGEATLTADGALDNFDGTLRLSDKNAAKLILEGDNTTAATFYSVNYNTKHTVELNGGDLTLTNSNAMLEYTGLVNVNSDELTIDADNGVFGTTALFQGTSDAVINVNSNATLWGTTSDRVAQQSNVGKGALDAFNGTINVADNTKLQLQGSNTTNAVFNGEAGSTLTINGSSSSTSSVTNTFNSKDAISNFDGKISIGTNDQRNTLVLKGTNTTDATITGAWKTTITANADQVFTGDVSAFKGTYDIAAGANVTLSGTIADVINAKGDTLTLKNETGKDVTVNAATGADLDNLAFGKNNVTLGAGDGDDFTNVTGTGNIVDFGQDQTFGTVTAGTIFVTGSEDALTIDTLTANVNITIDAAQAADALADVTVNGAFTGNITVNVGDGDYVGDGYKLATNSAFGTTTTITLTVNGLTGTLGVNGKFVDTTTNEAYLLQLKDQTLILSQVPGYSNYVVINGTWGSLKQYQSVMDGTTERIVGYDAASSLDNAVEYIKGRPTGLDWGRKDGDAKMELVKGTYKLTEGKTLMTEANEVTQLDLVGREGQKVTINGTLRGSDGSKPTSMLIENISTTGFVFGGGNLTINNSASVKTSGNAIAAGIATDNGSATMANNSKLTINGGYFTTSVLTGGSIAYGSTADVTVTGNTGVVINNTSGEKLTITGNIFGGSYAANGTVTQTGDASVFINAENATTLRGDIYVSGAVGMGTLNMSGNSYITFTGDASMLTFTGTVSAINQVATKEIAIFDDFSGKFNGSLIGFDSITISGDTNLSLGRRQTETGNTGLVFKVTASTNTSDAAMYTVRDANAWEFSKNITVKTDNGVSGEYILVNNYNAGFEGFTFNVNGQEFTLGSTITANNVDTSIYVNAAGQLIYSAVERTTSSAAKITTEGVAEFSSTILEAATNGGNALSIKDNVTAEISLKNTAVEGNIYTGRDTDNKIKTSGNTTINGNIDGWIDSIDFNVEEGSTTISGTLNGGRKDNTIAVEAGASLKAGVIATKSGADTVSIGEGATLSTTGTGKTITTGIGNDSVVIGKNATANISGDIDLGSGNDTLIVEAGATINARELNGGINDNDTLTMKKGSQINLVDDAAARVYGEIKGFEQINIDVDSVINNSYGCPGGNINVTGVSELSNDVAGAKMIFSKANSTSTLKIEGVEVELGKATQIAGADTAETSDDVWASLNRETPFNKPVVVAWGRTEAEVGAALDAFKADTTLGIGDAVVADTASLSDGVDAADFTKKNNGTLA